MIVRFDVRAEAELDAAIAYYDSQSARLGNQFLHEFRRTVDRILVFPNAWPKQIHEMRQCRVKRFPYGVVYLASDDVITIIAIAHLQRDYGYWRDRR